MYNSDRLCLSSVDDNRTVCYPSDISHTISTILKCQCPFRAPSSCTEDTLEKAEPPEIQKDLQGQNKEPGKPDTLITTAKRIFFGDMKTH